MPIKTKIREGIIYTELSGEISYDVIIDYIDFIGSLKGEIDCRYELHDHTNTASLKLSTDDIRNITSYAIKTNDIFQQSFLAIYAPNDITYGMARMFGAFYEMENRRIHAEIFRNRENAIHYLNEKMNGHARRPQ